MSTTDLRRKAMVPSASTAVHAQPASRPTKSAWAWVRLLGGVGILAFLVWRVGTGPFLDAIRVINGPALVAASAIGVVITVGCAWRWSLIAAGLGVRLPLPGAVASYYGSQFLNTTLPGGVLGDVHRAVRHGVDIGDVGLGVRAAVLDRLAGQTVQIVVTLVALFVFPSPVRPYLPVVTAVVVATGLGLAVVARMFARGESRWGRLLRMARADLRDGLFANRNWVGVGIASTMVVAGYLATFILAARTAGSTAPLTVLAPLTLLALMAMALPLNVAGWGPREGVAAWAFGAAGLTAAEGVATAVTYGLLVLVASLPGAVVLLVRWVGRAPSRVPALRQGGSHG